LHARFTTRELGDLHIDAPAAALAGRRRQVTTAPLLWLRQVHGSVIVSVDTEADIGRLAGTAADGAVTALSDIALSVTTADCAPVLLWDPTGGFATVHAGWRGTVEGVLEAAVGELRAGGGETVHAVLGPCIGPRDYEFGVDQLEVIAEALGDDVRSVTGRGAPALDLPAAVRSALAGVDVELTAVAGGDTAAESELYFSHRARHDPERQALIAWKT
jgi:hypothetical protein